MSAIDGMRRDQPHRTAVRFVAQITYEVPTTVIKYVITADHFAVRRKSRFGIGIAMQHDPHFSFSQITHSF